MVLALLDRAPGFYVIWKMAWRHTTEGKLGPSTTKEGAIKLFNRQVACHLNLAYARIEDAEGHIVQTLK